MHLRSIRVTPFMSNYLAYISTGGVEYTSTPRCHSTHEIVDDEEDSDWLVDVEAVTESMRQEAQVRLRAQSNELKRFHDKICLRVTARERQNRLEAQRAQMNLDAKCAKLFPTTESVQQTGDNAAVHISTRPYFQKLNEAKKVILKDCALGKHIENNLRLDAQIRDDLLRSTEISRLQISNEHENGDDGNLSEPAESPVLLPEQRVALYATVRRQYMEMNRAKIQSNVWREASQSPNSTKAKFPVSNTSVAGALRSSRTSRTDNSDRIVAAVRWATSPSVKVIDMTSGCEVRVHRQTTTSSTPWRKKSAKSPTTRTTTTEHERFLRALQAQLGTPALCSCGKVGPDSTSSTQPCANNCALYKQPKKREKLLASVYKQQQHDITTTAASPIR